MKTLAPGIVATAVAVLVACGGGGAGSGTSLPQATTVSGNAAKGLVRQAKVLVCRIVNGTPEPDTSCMSTMTGSDGAYSAAFSDGYTGPAMIKVMATATSTMLDEVTGTDIPYTMTMRAVVPAVSGATTVYVTPFSEMAAHAVAMGTMTPASISQSISTVQSAMAGLGIDLGVMPMMNLRNDGANAAMLTMQSNMVRQLSRVAMAARSSSLLTDANGVPCNTTGTSASQQLACAVQAMANAMSGQSSFDPARMAAVMAALNAQDVTGVTIPIVRPDGTISMTLVNMMSSASIQAALQNAGMPMTTATGMANTMMSGMH